MLHTETVEPVTLELLKQLMGLAALKDFTLVGGTALSLKFGHRKSIDLDLFSTSKFDNQELKDLLAANFDSFESSAPNTAPGVFAYIDGIKVDFVQYHFHPLIRPVEIVDGVRMASNEDIAAMKIFAILQRAKKKDFWDINLLLEKFGLENIISFYREKFPKNQMLISISQALLYFDDVENDEDPVSLQNITWEQVKKEIKKHVNNYLN
jgi:Nucleotidyl transferase AbiEii toxin, Type IV TA system